MPKLSLAAALLGGLFATQAAPQTAMATTYPVTLTDTAGRSVTLAHEPQRLVLQDGRDMMMLALLDRDDPVARVKVWNNLERRSDAGAWTGIAKTWPEADKIPDMGFGDDGEVDSEKMLAASPDLVVAERRTEGALENAGLVQRLAEMHIPLLFVDTFVQPVPGASDSVTLLGKALNRESEARQYTDFYADHLARLKQAAASVAPKPRVFVEPLAGRSGPDQCCFTHGHVGWGALLDQIGVVNIGGALLHSPTGEVTLETVLAQQPDVYVMSGIASSRPNAAFAAFGQNADRKQIDAALARLEQRPGFAQLKAAQDGRVYGIWHLFYSHVFNIVGLEYLAKFSYPAVSAQLDPDATYREILTRFTKLPLDGFIFAEKAPAVAP